MPASTNPASTNTETEQNRIVDLPGPAFKYTITAEAPAETVWQLWQDVDNWKEFDERLKYSYLESGYSFENGAVGYLKGKGAPKTRFVLENIDPGQSFDEILGLPLGQKILLKRIINYSDDNSTTFTHEVHFLGGLKGFFYPFLKGPFKKDIVLVMKAMKTLAEQRASGASGEGEPKPAAPEPSLPNQPELP